MDDVVEQVMASYEKLPASERLAREEIRVKVVNIFRSCRLQVTATPKSSPLMV